MKENIFDVTRSLWHFFSRRMQARYVAKIKKPEIKFIMH